MSQITTPPPHLPRQTYNPQAISSMLAQYSSQYGYLYSSVDIGMYSSLLRDLSSIWGYPNTAYTRPPSTLHTTTRPTLTNPTAIEAATSTSSPQTNETGLSSRAKLGIGIAVPLVLAALVGIGICLWCSGKRRGKKTPTVIPTMQYQPQQKPTIPGPQPAHFHQQHQQHHQQQQQQVYTPNPTVNTQGYMQGFQQPPQQHQHQHQHQPQQPQQQYQYSASPTPPPQYGQNQTHQTYAGATHDYGKGPAEGVSEMETEYHFARPGVVEMGDGMPEARK